MTAPATRIKVCGVTLPDDAARVASAGVDFIGLNFWPRSKRYLDPGRAPLLAGVIRATGPAKLVGVFVDADRDDIARVLRDVDLDVVQLHSDDSPDQLAQLASALGRPVWKAIAAGGARDLDRLETWPVDAILLDAPTPGRGGSGTTFDWSLARDARLRNPERRFVLAGGLRADNVAAAIAAVQPWAVDVASGVEAAPGVKDGAKVAAFVAAVRAADPRGRQDGVPC